MDTSLHTALSSMLTEGITQINVVDDDDKPLGSVRFDAIAHLVAPVDGPAAVRTSETAASDVR
jgi:predicted transcriptional regulator